jgi:hypothetical protein
MRRFSKLLGAAATFVAAVTVAGAALAQAPAAAGPPALPPGAHAAGMRSAPTLIAANHIPCTLVDARLANLKTPSAGAAILTEMACKEGMGYVVLVDHKPPKTDIFDCLIADQPGPTGEFGVVACVLPENVSPAAGLQYFVNQSGRTCTVDSGRFIGATTDGHRRYAVSCTSGQGLVLDVATATWTVTSCLAHATVNVECTLTTPASKLGEIPALAASAGKCPTPAKDRYMLTSQDGSDYFEIACPDGKGYVLHADRSGALSEAFPCAEANHIADGCTLTDPRQEETQKAALYSGLARSAGFDCTVSKYALFPQPDATKNIVELACSNRPDGGVGIFPAGGAGQVYDCVRSRARGYKCTLTPESAVYPKLSAALRTAGKGSCVVSNARPLARGDDGWDYVEVGCADGGSGWVVIYPPASPKPTQAFSCAKARSLNGGCQLPGDRKS